MPVATDGYPQSPFRTFQSRDGGLSHRRLQFRSAGAHPMEAETRLSQVEVYLATQQVEVAQQELVRNTKWELNILM